MLLMLMIFWVTLVEALLSHLEILNFQLLDTIVQRPILVSQLYELLINIIHRHLIVLVLVWNIIKWGIHFEGTRGHPELIV